MVRAKRTFSVQIKILVHWNTGSPRPRNVTFLIMVLAAPARQTDACALLCTTYGNLRHRSSE